MDWSCGYSYVYFTWLILTSVLEFWHQCIVSIMLSSFISVVISLHAWCSLMHASLHAKGPLAGLVRWFQRHGMGHHYLKISTPQLKFENGIIASMRCIPCIKKQGCRIGNFPSRSLYRVDSGNFCSQFVLTKIRSNFSKVGTSAKLAKVNLRP